MPGAAPGSSPGGDAAADEAPVRFAITALSVVGIGAAAVGYAVRRRLNCPRPQPRLAQVAPDVIELIPMR